MSDLTTCVAVAVRAINGTAPQLGPKRSLTLTDAVCLVHHKSSQSLRIVQTFQDLVQPRTAAYLLWRHENHLEAAVDRFERGDDLLEGGGRNLTGEGNSRAGLLGVDLAHLVENEPFEVMISAPR